MSDVPELDAAGLPEELSAFDQILHRGEANPRTRSGIMTVELLDTTPDWERFRARFDNASRKVLRLRQKVVMPTLPTVAPRWVIDPDFNLDFHVRRMRVPEPGTLRQVFDLAEVAAQSPLDISRPLWTATLVEGLEGGRAAQLVHLSHAVTDGVGGVEMFANLYDLERDPPPQAPPPLPIPQDLSPNDLMRQGFNRLPGTIAGRVRGVLFGAAHVVGEMVRDPISRMGGVVEYAMSGARVVGPVAPPSPVLRRRSLSSRSEAIDIEFGDLHKAAKAAGGSINDAYLAGLCGALAPLPRGQGRADRGAADGGAGQPAVRGGSGRRQPVRRGQSRRADRPARPGSAHQEHPFADDAQARGACDRHGRRHRAGAHSAAGRRARVDGRIDRQLRRPGQQCAGLRGRHLHRRGKDLAAVRHWPAARCGDDGGADLARRLLHDHHTLRPRRRSPTPTCGRAACWPASTRCSPSAATVEPRRRRSRIDAPEPTPVSPNGSAAQ